MSQLGQLKTTEEVMLWFIAPPANDRSKQDAKTWKERLNKIVYAVCDQLHPKGTVIAHIPQPYYDHATGVAGESFTAYVLCVRLLSMVQENSVE